MEGSVEEVLEPLSLKYTWSNLTFLVSPASQGTSFIGQLEYTENGCTAQFDVFGLYPAVTCMTDEDCLDPAAGINSDLIANEAVYCDLDLGMCAKKDDTP